jgi:predicted nucleic acid-binding protein
VLYSARSAQEFDDLQEELDALRDLPINRSVCQTALWAVREIKHSTSPCRISPPDALIAAAAHHATGVAGVLHYDHHYDRLAGVLGLDSTWIVPPGTIP